MKEKTRKEEALKRIGNWLIEGDTGMSSLSLCAVYLGSDLQEVSHPHDYADFDRCIKFTQKLNAEEVNQLLDEIANRSESWARIRENWDELLRLYNREDSESFCKLLKKLDRPKENEIIIEL